MERERLLDRMTAALGGRERLIDSRFVRSEGEIAIGDMHGGFTTVQDPISLREFISIDMKALKLVEGYDGTILWSVDRNGKVTTNADRGAIGEFRARRRFHAHRYLTHRDEYEVAVNESETEIILRIVDLAAGSGSTPSGTFTLAVDPATMLPARLDASVRGDSETTHFTDYQPVDGIQMPMVVNITDASGNLTVMRNNRVELLEAIDESMFDPPEDVVDYRFLHGGSSATVPLHIPFDHLYAEVVIDGRSYEFAVDTGAGATVVALDLAKELGLETLGTIQGMGVSGPQEMTIVKVPKLVVGDVALLDQQVIAIDLGEISKSLPRMRGLLGMDFLNRFVVRLDYVRGEMEVFDRQHFVYEGIGVELPLDGINVEMSVDGHTGKFRVDTGAPGVALHTPFVKRYNLLANRDRLAASSSIAGVGSVELTMYAALCHDVTIGGFQLRDIPIALADIETGAFANDEIVGNAGGEIWRRFITHFDFTGGRMFIEPSSAFDDPPRVNRLGLRFLRVGGRCVVDAVSTNTPAALIGVTRGDELLELDGRLVRELTPEELSMELSAPAGTTRRLRFHLASGAIHEIEATLSDYLRYYDDAESILEFPRPVVTTSAGASAATSIRSATPADVPLILALIRELAEYERMSADVVATEELLHEALFCERPKAEVLIASEGASPVGFALFFHNFSTFLGRPGIYLEDLFVRPEARGKGHGRALLVALARLAAERGCGRLEWSVLDWNEPSIGFYKALGAVPMDEWTVFRVTGESLKKLAAG